MSEPNDPKQPQTFPLRHRILGRMPSIFAQNLLIQATPEAVVLSFFETVLPPKPVYTEEDVEQLKEVGVVAECIARIAMPQSAFLEAADAMQRVAQTMRDAAAAAEKGDENAKLQ
jgi:hypothetical protein